MGRIIIEQKLRHKKRIRKPILFYAKNIKNGSYIHSQEVDGEVEREERRYTHVIYWSMKYEH